jgi:hypothetical protein
MVKLVPITKEAQEAIQGDTIHIDRFPFRFGRESRRNGEHVSPEIRERRNGKTPPNNDCYLRDNGALLHISREHFQIEKAPANGYTLFDRMSACGTTVRGESGDQHCQARRCALSNNAIIFVGTPASPYRFRFEYTPEDLPDAQN